ncbi:c-type cytochrome [Achromobacter xylosoxidans]
MIEHRNGILIAVALMVGVPAITLVATLHQMFGTGGEGPIRASAVQAPRRRRRPHRHRHHHRQRRRHRPPRRGRRHPPASAAATPAAPAPVPGRGALDFSASRPVWEGYLRGADPEQGKQLAAAGKPAAGVQACVACHGQAGITPSGGIFPNLAGLTAEYIAKQLADFRQGTRKQPLMNTIAQGLSEQEIGQLAAYYGSLAGPPLHVGEAGGEAARKLDQVGDGTRALPACANCHGLRGLGEGPLLPRLAGQSKEYFADQINAFRNGSRQNDDVGVMRAFAQRLTDSEVEALGQYYAGTR